MKKRITCLQKKQGRPSKAKSPAASWLSTAIVNEKTNLIDIIFIFIFLVEFRFERTILIMLDKYG